MDIPESEIISVIYHLLPGFAAAWIFYGLTAHPKASPFERVVQALIFTAATQVVVIPVRAGAIVLGDRVGSVGEWTTNSSFLLSMVTAVLLGLLFSAMANTSWLHSRLPDWLTKRTSYPSEWFSAFNKDKRFVYLHLTGQRRIYGWPTEWPDHTDKGHFVLQRAEWIAPDNRRAPLHLTDRMLIPADEVVMVEFEKERSEWDFSDEQLASSVATMIELQHEDEEDEPTEARSGERIGERPSTDRCGGSVAERSATGGTNRPVHERTATNTPGGIVISEDIPTTSTTEGLEDSDGRQEKQP